jgi:alpha-ribazole phosphatase CobZ
MKELLGLAMLRGVRRVNERTVLVEFSQPMEITSTVPALEVGGDFTDYVEGLIFYTVPKNFEEGDMLSFYEEILRSTDLKRGIVFITAVPIDKLRHIALDDNLHIFATIGLSPPTCIKTSNLYEPLTISTINIAIAVNYPLTHSAMIDLLRVVAEAKAIATSDSILRCESRSSGTVTDAIAILKPFNMGNEILFAGMNTTIGNKVAKAVHKMIVAEVVAREINDVLKDVLGHNIEELVELFLKVYRQSPIPGVPEDAIREEACKLLKQFFRDPNVWSFLIASRELDLHGSSGTIPGLSEEEFAEDSKKIVADELLGMSLATYLAGSKAVLSMYWVEKLKESRVVEHWKSNMFEDDIISALIASLLTRILDEYM